MDVFVLLAWLKDWQDCNENDVPWRVPSLLHSPIATAGSKIWPGNSGWFHGEAWLGAFDQRQLNSFALKVSPEAAEWVFPYFFDLLWEFASLFQISCSCLETIQYTHTQSISIDHCNPSVFQTRKFSLVLSRRNFDELLLGLSFEPEMSAQRAQVRNGGLMREGVSPGHLSR